MRRRRSRKERHEASEDMNITAFMNLMVVLVPFLLITAVFSRLAILELNLPTSQANASEQQAPEFQLEVIVRESAIEVGDRTAGLLRRFESGADGHDLDGLSRYLAEVKRQFPAKLDATLLLEPDIPYELIVDVMDRLRVAGPGDAGAGLPAGTELFPEIAIGDAPAARPR
ncbi:MAG TPA: biopolymer transporter ExbD [Gammaproteobacteria bacterium]